jgi:hypothetical protein
MSLMHFNELVPGATVRFTDINGIQYISIRDIIKLICNKDESHAMDPWRNLSQARKTELQAFCFNFKFDGKRERMQPVITFPGALKLLQWLGHSKVMNFHMKFTEILSTYFSGDKHLLRSTAVDSSNGLNHVSQSQVEPTSSADSNEETLVKRRKLHEDFTASVCVSSTEVKQFSLSLSECNMQLEKYILLQNQMCDAKERMCDANERMNKIDIKHEHDKLTIERAKLALLHDGRCQDLEYKRALKALEATDAAMPPPSASIPTAVPDAAAATTTLFKVYDGNKENYPMLRFDQRKSFLQKSGALTAQLYRQTYGTNPPFKQLESGIEVNAYPVEAEPLLLEALRTVYREFTAGESQPAIDAVFKKTAVETA